MLAFFHCYTIMIIKMMIFIIITIIIIFIMYHYSYFYYYIIIIIILLLLLSLLTLTAFACNAKVLQYTMSLFFFSFFLYCVFGGTDKSCLCIFPLFLLLAHVANIRLIKMIYCVLSSHKLRTEINSKVNLSKSMWNHALQ